MRTSQSTEDLLMDFLNLVESIVSGSTTRRDVISGEGRLSDIQEYYAKLGTLCQSYKDDRVGAELEDAQDLPDPPRKSFLKELEELDVIMGDVPECLELNGGDSSPTRQETEAQSNDDWLDMAATTTAVASSREAAALDPHQADDDASQEQESLSTISLLLASVAVFILLCAMLNLMYGQSSPQVARANDVLSTLSTQFSKTYAILEALLQPTLLTARFMVKLPTSPSPRASDRAAPPVGNATELSAGNLPAEESMRSADEVPDISSDSASAAAGDTIRRLSVERLTCPACKKVFSKHYNRNKHMRTGCSLLALEKFRCRRCPAAFSTKWYREKHEGGICKSI